MLTIRNVDPSEKELLNDIVSIHLDTFAGFFLTFMGRGFLRQMYLSYCEGDKSGLLVAQENGEAVGFLAYSGDLSGLYRFMLKRHLLPLAWYSLGAFFRKPSAFLRIIRALRKPREAKRVEKYVELASIGVSPKSKSKGIGSLLVQRLKTIVDFEEYAYIALETDADHNDAAIRFYEKNAFTKVRIFKTPEGRRMIEFRFGGKI